MSYTVTLPRYHRYAILPTFMTKRTIHRRPSPPPSGRVERVVLARLTDDLRPFWFKVGVIEDTVGDEVLVRFGEVVIQVPPEWIEGVED